MKPDSEKHPQAQARPAAGKAPVIAGIVALAVVASVAWWFLGEPERLLDVDADPPPGARTDAEPIPGLPDGAADGRSRREVSPPEVAASRRVIPRLRDDPKLPPADTGIEPEDVIENEPGKDFGPGIDARDYIEALREMGETEGIAAFPPPGTDPPKTGVIVPDDYELPVGYERYYQYSDDGKPLDAILVYSSDYEFLDEQGDPIPIPEDRVVPPEAAPPDLPREMLDPEKPIESDRLIDQTPEVPARRPSRSAWRARALHLAALGATGVALHLYARVASPGHMLAFVALVPWLAALDRVRSARAALLSGLLMSGIFALSVFAWFGSAMASYAGAPTWLGFVLLLLLAPLLQPQLVLFGWARYLAGSPAARGLAALHRALAGAFVYVAAEWTLPKLFADTLGHGLHPSLWLRQGADVAGASGLTLALLLFNEAALRTLRGWRRGKVQAPGVRSAPGGATLADRVHAAIRPAACALVIVGSLAGYGAWRLSMLREEEPKPVLLRAALVQADLSRYARLREELGTFDAAVQILERHFELSDQALTSGPVDVLVWPETVYPTTFGTPKSEEGAEFDRAIAGFSALRGVPLVFGAYDVEEGEEYNAAFFLAPGGDVAVYRKEALFPLTERVPVWLAAEPVRRWLPWLGTWRAGSGPRLVSMPLADGRTLRVGPLICYDAVDPLLARASARAGAELLVTLSNDSWFDVGSGPRLHLVVSAFRSIETRLPQIRATNTGITAAIDAEGTLLASLAVHQRDVLVAEVPAGPAVATLMLRWGDWLGPTALGGAGALLLAARVRACRSDDRNPARFRDPSRS